MRKSWAVVSAVVLVLAVAPAVDAGRAGVVKVVITDARITQGPAGNLDFGYAYTGTGGGNHILVDNYNATTAYPQILEGRLTLTLTAAQYSTFKFFLYDAACPHWYWSTDAAPQPVHHTLADGKGQSQIYYFADAGPTCANADVDVAPSPTAGYDASVTFVVR